MQDGQRGHAAGDPERQADAQPSDAEADAPAAAPADAPAAAPAAAPADAPAAAPASDADELIAVARDLEAGSGRSRRGVSRRRGRILHDGVVHDDAADAVSGAPPTRARVRSEAHEGADGDRAATDQTAPDATSATLLGASGDPILVPDATDATDAPDATHADVPAGSAASGPTVAGTAGTAGTVVDPTVFLVMAVRSYLEGLDQHGADDPLTRDRLARLRATLAIYDGDRDV